jgi:hypothetical protein
MFKMFGNRKTTKFDVIMAAAAAVVAVWKAVDTAKDFQQDNQEEETQ